MNRFDLSMEHVSSAAFPKIREFCKGKGIRVTKAAMSEIFTGQAVVRVSCENKRGANKVRDFVWNEINGGAYCSVEKVT